MSNKVVSFALCSFVFGLCAFWAPNITNAQFTDPGNTTLSIVASQSTPGPHQSLTLSLDNYGSASIGSTVVWYVDGVEMPSYRNQREITVETGGIGETQTVSAYVQNGASGNSASYTITPRVIDLIVEAETYTPYFYKGRALPSSNANIRLVAIVHDGSGRAPSQYAYRWTVGEDVLSKGVLTGGYSVETSMPFFDGNLATVDVYDLSGNLLGSERIVLNAIDSKMVFYEQNVLRGLSQRAVSGRLNTESGETTIFAEPYFFKNTQLTSNTSDFTWSINGETTKGAISAPNAITLEGDVSSSAHLEAKVITLERRARQAKGSITVEF